MINNRKYKKYIEPVQTILLDERLDYIKTVSQQISACSLPHMEESRLKIHVDLYILNMMYNMYNYYT